MKNILFAVSVALSLIACNENTNNKAAAPDKETSRENVVTTNANPSSTLSFIKNWEGKTAREAGMFSDSLLVNRLKNLLGNEYIYFQENWNVQTPIEKENNIYAASGCKQHDCSAYYSIVYFDTEKNNINVLIQRGVHFKIFTEKGEIDLPENMKKNQGIIRENA